ncbi:RPA family protein [Methanocalculus alkaliphilus]|uniref:hypothetical protein n=1 Tax=Methanocalculus alkaliphilus TaxID=768730 RepID=UPI00209E7DF9|nr:hypothetical protein [Methanocalculus alkaliphilus]MCP1714636.1 RPA family protein [Methanocalculus alkaliphilus]
MEQAAEPISWVFAGECHAAIRKGDRFITPTGAHIRRLFMVGVLTGLHVLSSRSVEGRISDPTGGISITVNRSYPLVADHLASTEPPAFIAVAGELSQKGSDEIRLIVDACRTVTREERDRFLQLCAEDTLCRLEEQEDLSPSQREIAGMVQTALVVISDAEEQETPDRNEAMIEIISSVSGPKGASLEDIMRLAGDAGIGEDEVKAILTTLLEEGECYMPTNGVIRLL